MSTTVHNGFSIEEHTNVLVPVEQRGFYIFDWKTLLKTGPFATWQAAFDFKKKEAFNESCN